MMGPGFAEAAFAPFFAKALAVIAALIAAAFLLGAWVF